MRNQGPVKNRKCFRACPSLRKKYRCLRRVKRCYSRERLLSTQSHLTPKRPSKCQALRIHRRTQSRVLKMGNGIHLYHQPQQLPAPFPARVTSEFLLEDIEMVFLGKQTKTVIQHAISSNDLSTSLQQIHLTSEYLPCRHESVKVHATRISVCLPSNLICSRSLILTYQCSYFCAQQIEYFQRNK